MRPDVFAVAGVILLALAVVCFMVSGVALLGGLA